MKTHFSKFLCVRPSVQTPIALESVDFTSPKMTLPPIKTFCFFVKFTTVIFFPLCHPNGGQQVSVNILECWWGAFAETKYAYAKVVQKGDAFSKWSSRPRVVAKPLDSDGEAGREEWRDPSSEKNIIRHRFLAFLGSFESHVSRREVPRR